MRSVPPPKNCTTLRHNVGKAAKTHGQPTIAPKLHACDGRISNLIPLDKVLRRPRMTGTDGTQWTKALRNRVTFMTRHHAVPGWLMPSTRPWWRRRRSTASSWNNTKWTAKWWRRWQRNLLALGDPLASDQITPLASHRPRDVGTLLPHLHQPVLGVVVVLHPLRSYSPRPSGVPKGQVALR